MLLDELFVNLVDTDLQDQIALSEDMDGIAADALKVLLEDSLREMTHGLNDWEIRDINGRNTLFYKGRNYIPKDFELQQDLVKSFHDHKTAGHPGEIGTYNAVYQHYW